MREQPQSYPTAFSVRFGVKIHKNPSFLPKHNKSHWLTNTNSPSRTRKEGNPFFSTKNTRTRQKVLSLEFKNFNCSFSQRITQYVIFFFFDNTTNLLNILPEVHKNIPSLRSDSQGEISRKNINFAGYCDKLFFKKFHIDQRFLRNYSKIQRFPGTTAHWRTINRRVGNLGR